MLDMQSLRIIWWLLVGILFMGFAIADGFDFGAALLLPLVARNEYERNIVLSTVKPFWEGNQVWIILGAGAVFAAWPYVYAVAFSGFYLLILLLLLTMGISRPVSFKYRGKLNNLRWRRTWDWIVVIGGLFPAVIFGILIGNILSGLPFYFDNNLHIYYSGGFFSLFNSFTLCCGLTSLALLTMHGGLYLAIKTEQPIRQRAVFYSRIAALFVILSFAAAGYWVAYHLFAYELISQANPYGFSNPLHKEVVSKLGGWMNNYKLYPLTILIPALGFIGAAGAFFTAHWGSSRFAFICSSLSIIGLIGTVGISMFPFILPSSTNLASSLLVWDASSSELTLLLMLVAAIIFLPIILLYTSWVYHALGGKVTTEMKDY
jgi:cytochrome bd ubiquinol oxidase subunit II